MSALHSRLCVGWVRHRRLLPKNHAFRYPVFMSWLDQDKLDRIMKQSFFWSRERSISSAQLLLAKPCNRRRQWLPRNEA